MGPLYEGHGEGIMGGGEGEGEGTYCDGDSIKTRAPAGGDMEHATHYL